MVYWVLVYWVYWCIRIGVLERSFEHACAKRTPTPPKFFGGSHVPTHGRGSSVRRASYSYLRLSTGSTDAALIDCALTVNHEISITASPAAMSGKTPTSM